MPLYIYKCENCGTEVEKFQHNGEDELDVLCAECGGGCEKQIPFTKNRTLLDANTMYSEKIQPEVDRILDNVSKGKDRDFLDICGD